MNNFCQRRLMLWPIVATEGNALYGLVKIAEVCGRDHND